MNGEALVSTARVALVALLLQAAAPVRAQEMDVPVALQFPLLLKVLQFDRNLPARAGNDVVIGVVYQGRFRTAFRVKEEMEEAAKEMEQPRILNLPVRLVGIDLERTDLAAAIDSLHVDVVYVAPLRARDVSTISQMTRARRVRSVTGVEDYVRGGISIGVGVAQEKPCIVINLDATRSEGADFSSRLLSLAKLVQ